MRKEEEKSEGKFPWLDAFSLRDEIGLCPNIEIEIDMTDKSPFFIRPFHTNEDVK